ncbi:MAG TPA: hypothetical protein VFO85_19270, partial [Vicinamibacteria bacterium]|nr:hypothetical protein [Vicinamibacteria bacterium]
MRAFVARRMRADHHRYEQMARRVRNPGRVGCWTGAAEGGLMEGIALNVYRPRNPALPPVLAFGNTRLPEELTNIEQLGEFVSDLRADFDALEIGGYRWALNDGRIKGLLDSLTGEFGRKVVLTGHSLGGTLAQITACHYWPQVHSVVTFQSPRIGHSFARLARHLAAATVDDPSSRSFHYQMEQDEIITEAGYVLSPGFRIQFRWTPSIVMAMAHAAAALVQQLVRLLPEAGEIASIIIAVLREIGESIEWAVQNYLAHTVHFFEPYVEVADPSQIDPSDLSAQYEHIREDPTDRRLPAAANATEWIRQRAPLLTGGLASLALTGGVFPSPALIAVERMRRSVYVLIWEHLKDTIDADIARGRRPRRDLANLRFPLRQVHAGLQLLPFDAVRVVTEREHEQIRQNLAWVYPEHFARGRSGPIVPGPLVPPPPAPRQALVDEEGRLTDAGWALVEADAERGDRPRPQMDALLNGYYTGAQAQGPSGRADRGSYWLEKLTAAEAALQFAATPVAESDPRILAGRQPGGGAVIIASGKALGALFTFLAGRAGRRLLALPPEVLQRHGELRAWSVMRVLVEGI